MWFACPLSSAVQWIVPQYFLMIFALLVPPQWSLEPRDVAVLHREIAVINCAATGNPRPTISWRKSSGDTSGNSGAVIHFQCSGRLFINSPGFRNTGKKESHKSRGEKILWKPF